LHLLRRNPLDVSKTPSPERGLPPKVTIPILVVGGILFFGLLAYFLRVSLSTSGSALGRGPSEQGDARIAATAAPAVAPTPAAAEDTPPPETIPQSGGIPQTGGLPAGAALPPIAGSGDQPQGGGQGASQPGAGAQQGGGDAAGGPPAPVLRLLNSLRDRIAQNPNDLQALVGLATLYFDAQKFDQAAPYYRRALAIDPENQDTRTDYATALHATGHDLEALGELQKVLAKQPNFAPALFNEGIVASTIGRRSQAIDAFKRFLAVSPKDPKADEARAALKNLGA
jgi:tetratricopeptide (TPR) repeat protein